jgi:hypothetical protein
MSHEGQPADWIAYDDQRRIISKSLVGDKSDQVNPDSFYQPEGIHGSEFATAWHLVHSRILCRQGDYSSGGLAGPTMNSSRQLNAGLWREK